MSKRRIVLIFVLAGLSLSGIILVQAFWIRNALQVKEAQLDASVKEALGSLTRKIEKRKVALLAANLEADTLAIPQYAVTTSTHVERIVPPRITIRSGVKPKAHTYYTTRRIDRKPRVHRNTQTNVFVFSDSLVSSEHDEQIALLQQLQIDSIETVVAEQVEKSLQGMNITIDNHPSKGLGERKRMSWIYGPKSIKKSAEDILVVTSKDNGDGNSKWIELVQSAYKKKVNVLRQIAIDADASRLPLQKRLDFDSLGKLIKAELKDRGVDADASFCVYSGMPQKAVYKSVGYDSLYDGKVYRTGLFPENIIPLSDTIKVYLPQRQQQIYASAVIPSIASLVFTLIIIVTFYLTIRTILSQKRLAEMKADFINNMTHELKTPISTIRLAVDSIDNPKTIGNPESIKYFTKAIRDENFRMNRMVEQVLQAARLDRREVKLSPVELDFNDLVFRVVSKMSIIAAERGGVIHFESANVPLIILGDVNHMESMVFNLLDNAIKYTKTAPLVQVGLSKTPEAIILKVEDNGIGISKEDQPRIFEKFFRVSHGNVHDVKGFGLGLSYVKEIVTLHGGVIKLKSELGKGTTFTVFFPDKRA